MPSINDLTEDQVKLLDTMWAIDTDDEFKSWYHTLDRKTQKEVEILAEMLYLAEVDDLVNIQDETALAKQMLGNMGIVC
jgi:hypothetical protein